MYSPARSSYLFNRATAHERPGYLKSAGDDVNATHMYVAYMYHTKAHRAEFRTYLCSRRTFKHTPKQTLWVKNRACVRPFSSALQKRISLLNKNHLMISCLSVPSTSVYTHIRHHHTHTPLRQHQKTRANDARVTRPSQRSISPSPFPIRVPLSLFGWNDVMGCVSARASGGCRRCCVCIQQIPFI